MIWFLRRELQKERRHLLGSFRSPNPSFSTHEAHKPNHAAPSGPVVTFLSTNSRHSRSAVEFLRKIFDFPTLDDVSAKSSRATDQLDEFFFGPDSYSWGSVACFCPSSGAVLHFLSLDGDDSRSNNSKTQAEHSLISIHGGSLNDDSANITSCTDAVIQSRVRLAEEIQTRQFFQPGSVLSSVESHLRGRAIRLMHQMGKQIAPSWLLAKQPTSSSYQPLHLDLRPFNSVANNNFAHGKTNGPFQLREVAIPFHPELSTLQQQLSKSSLLRPKAGLYQFTQQTKSSQPINNGLILRPLPSASEDFRLPQPSLICQCTSLPEAQDRVEKEFGAAIAKIGWRGDGQNGSLIVSHPSIRGLDIRLVEASGEWVPNSFFDEAQEALLAASLDDLQSSHVITEGSEGSDKRIDRKIDPKTLNADCWVETRANVKNPLGFLSKRWSLTSQHKTTVAKPPELPYE